MATKLLEKCIKIYAAMEAEAEGDVWAGSTTALFDGEEGVSRSSYTQVKDALESMECIKQVQRGGGTAPSIWMLVQPPTEELYQNTRGKPTRQAYDKQKIMKQQLSTVIERLSAAETEILKLRTRVLNLENKVKVPADVGS